MIKQFHLFNSFNLTCSNKFSSNNSSNSSSFQQPRSQKVKLHHQQQQQQSLSIIDKQHLHSSQTMSSINYHIQDSPISDEQYEEQPLDFSKKSTVAIMNNRKLLNGHTKYMLKNRYNLYKSESNNNYNNQSGDKSGHLIGAGDNNEENDNEEEEDDDEIDVDHNDNEHDLSDSKDSKSIGHNCYSTPSPSPPEINTSNQVLCQLLKNSSAIKIESNEPKMKLNKNKNANNSHVRHSPCSPMSRQQKEQQQSTLTMHERISSSLSSMDLISPINKNLTLKISNDNQTDDDRFNNNGGLLTTTSPLSSMMNSTPFAPNSTNVTDPRKIIKYTRPFKAYQRENTVAFPVAPPFYYSGNNSFQMPSAEVLATQSIIASVSDQQYLQFREQMLSQKKVQETRRTRPSNGQAVNNDISSSNGNNNNNCTESSSNLNDDNSQISNSGASSGGEDDNSSSNLINSPGEITGIMNSSGNSAHQRKRGKPLPDDQKDEAYWERRRKNNEAAKRSRDARRAKEDEIAIRAAFLEQENMKLRVEIASLKNETAKLRCLLYNN